MAVIEATNLADGPNEPIIEVRRQWNDYRLARYRLKDIDELHWSNYSSGGFSAPGLFVHGYVRCDQMLSGKLSHSCQHGPPPHRLKVSMTKTGNEAIWSKILERAGPKPRW